MKKSRRRNPKRTRPAFQQPEPERPNIRRWEFGTSIIVVFALVLVIVCSFLLAWYSGETTDIEKGIQFLQSKGVLANHPLAGLEFSLLRDPTQIQDSQLRAEYQAARERLLRLVQTKEEVHLTTVPAGVHLWNESEFPGYKPNDVFFLKHPNALNQRHQLSGLCYLHAPAMVQHYALTHNNHSAPMVDLVKFIREHFSAKALQRHIFDNAGGSSVTFLKGLLQPNSTLITRTLDDTPSTISEMLNSYGPGLVSGFEVYTDFTNHAIHRHYGNHSGTYVGQHAMSLVGYRKNCTEASTGSKAANCTQYYMLQNWWRRKQFVEVDATYLEQSGASVWFIKTPQTEVPSNFAVNNGTFFELEAIDKEEGYLLEMWLAMS